MQKCTQQNAKIPLLFNILLMYCLLQLFILLLNSCAQVHKKTSKEKKSKVLSFSISSRPFDSSSTYNHFFSPSPPPIEHSSRSPITSPRIRSQGGRLSMYRDPLRGRTISLTSITYPLHFALKAICYLQRKMF